MYLIISTLAKNSAAAQELLASLTTQEKQAKLIETEGLKISHCIGCNDCWIKTPGICCMKDDYEKILIEILRAQTVIFITNTRLGFVSAKTKNLFDRILPILTMHLRIKNGQMQHYTRYGKNPDMALLYEGEADKDFINLWLSRVQRNLHGKSLGAYQSSEKEGLYHALDYH